MMAIRLHRGGLRNGILASMLLALLVVIGSRRLLYFDAVLLPYLFATLFAVMGIVYRYTVWLDRPPTRRLWDRSIHFLMSPYFLGRLWLIIRTFFNQIILQRFVGERSIYRWVMHFCIAWGTIIAFAVTFPLTFGWLHFETPLGSPEMYQLYMFGFPSLIFDPHGAVAWAFYNTLNVAAIMVVAGSVMAFVRRILHPGLVAFQSFADDMLPLLILFSVGTTGLFLTYSSHLLGGQHFRVLATLHCFTVVVFLVYLPFGKFFHIFQRGAQMGAAVYIHERKKGLPARCIKCQTPYTGLMQREDVKDVLGILGFRYSKKAGGETIQDLCPLCRRRIFMLAQHRRLKGQFDREGKVSE